MNKLDELMALLQKQEKEEEKCKNTVMWVLAIIGAVAAGADHWSYCSSSRHRICSISVFHTGLSGRL